MAIDQKESAEFDNKVGPVLRAGELANAVVEAMIEDNPERHVEVIDKRAYLRVQVDQECIVRRKTIEKYLGRPFKMQEIEVVLGSFAGQVDTTEEAMRFYFAQEILSK